MGMTAVARPPAPVPWSLPASWRTSAGGGSLPTTWGLSALANVTASLGVSMTIARPPVALLRRDQGQGQDLAGGSHESEAGTADGRADEALPRTVDKRQAPVAESVQDIARDQDPFRTETIEERTRRERYHCGRAHDRRQHQPRGRRREAPARVEVDDLEGKDQSGAEVVERVSALKNEDRPR